VRNTALGVANEAPTSDINREYYVLNQEAKVHPSIDRSGVFFDTCRRSQFTGAWK
jgi:hypothetical protein